MFSTKRIPATLEQCLREYIEPSEALERDFVAAARLEKVPKGAMVLKQGEVNHDFVINRVGLFRVGHTHDGVEDTLMFGSAGDIYAAPGSYFRGEPSVMFIQSLDGGEVWRISHDEFRKMMKSYPELRVWFQALLLEQLSAIERRYLYFGNRNAEDRFLNFLKRHEMNPKGVALNEISRIVPLKYIAQYLQMTPATLSRLRNKLAKGTLDGKQ